MPSTPSAPSAEPPTAAGCLRRAAALLTEAERPTVSPAEAALKVQIAGGWRELAMAAGYLDSERNG
jgi:hypothetical protein